MAAGDMMFIWGEYKNQGYAEYKNGRRGKG